MSSKRFVLLASLCARFRRFRAQLAAGFGLPQGFAFCRSLLELLQLLLLSFFLGAALPRALLPVVGSKSHGRFLLSRDLRGWDNGGCAKLAWAAAGGQVGCVR